jgi:hypothetical protein
MGNKRAVTLQGGTWNFQRGDAIPARRRNADALTFPALEAPYEYHVGVDNDLLTMNTHRVGRVFDEYRDSRQAVRRAGQDHTLL